MKITSFKETAKSGIKVFKPIQYLYLTGSCDTIDGVKVRVRVVNGETGRVDEIIPFLSLSVLGEITSMNEGFFCYNTQSHQFMVNVMLHPTSAIYLSNNKYIEIDIEGVTESTETAIYGIERNVVDKDFICRYNKFYMAEGELQKSFAVGDNEDVILPQGSFEEVVLNYKNGTTCTYTQAELVALMMLKNDIVCIPQPVCNFSAMTSQSQSLVFGSWFMKGLDISEVETITIRRSAGTTSYELVMIDTLKD